MTKLATFADAKGPRVGAVLPDGGMLDLSAVAPGGVLAGRTQDMLALIEGGAAALAEVRRSPPHRPPRHPPAGGWTLLAPIPRPRRNVFCVGRNYMDHVAEGTHPRHRQFRVAQVPAILHQGARHRHRARGLDPRPIPVPSGWTTRSSWPPSSAPRAPIPREQALDHVFGWTIGNDVTAATCSARYGQWFKGKSLDRSCRSAPGSSRRASWTR